MEAKARPKPSKPLESEPKDVTASSNWRNKTRASTEESEEDDQGTPAPEKRVRWAERSEKETDKAKRVELPYKSVKPVDMGSRTHPIFTKENTLANAALAGKSYRVRAPIQRDGATDEMIDQIHNTEVTVKLGDLFGLSRELREGERLKLTKVRQPVMAKVPEAVNIQGDVEEEEVEEPLPTEEVLDLPLGHDTLDIEELPKVGVFISTKAIENVPVGSIVARDPYLQYLESLPSGERPKQVYVAKESAPLQAVFPVINQPRFGISDSLYVVECCKTAGDRLGSKY